jgi:hypothetical protein
LILNYIADFIIVVYGYNERIWTLATLWWESKSWERKIGDGEDRPKMAMIEIPHPDGLF